MTDRFAPFSRNVTLIGGGELATQTVSECLTLAPILVACDGAARAALEMGQVPARVVGDMDSIDAETRARLDPATLVEISEQESTDFEKALRTTEAPLILAAGFLGRRVDHQLASFNALVKYADRRCILVGEEDVCFHAGGPVRLDLMAGTRVSLFPMAEVGAVSRGLEWPTDGLTLAPAGRIGTSNRALGGLVEIVPDGPGLVVILPRSALRVAVGAVMGEGGRPASDAGAGPG